MRRLRALPMLIVKTHIIFAFVNGAPTKIYGSRYSAWKDLEMRFTFKHMNEQDDRAIAGWHYEFLEMVMP